MNNQHWIAHSDDERPSEDLDEQAADHPAFEASLLIGFMLSEAIEVLTDEGLAYDIRITSPPAKLVVEPAPEHLRVIAVRLGEAQVELVCAVEDWSVS